MPLCIAWRRTSSPAPGVEGGNDGLHGDGMILGERVDKEDGGRFVRGSVGLVSWLGVQVVEWERS